MTDNHVEIKTITIGQMTFTSTIYEYYTDGSGVEVEMPGGYNGDEVTEDFDAKDMQAIIDFFQDHHKRHQEAVKNNK